jgi:hypothetical protein
MLPRWDELEARELKSRKIFIQKFMNAMYRAYAAAFPYGLVSYSVCRNCFRQRQGKSSLVKIERRRRKRIYRPRALA